MSASKMRIAYILTPITFGGAEKVSLNFLRNVDRSKIDIRPILLVRPWESELFFSREIRAIGYELETVPVAIKARGDFLRVARVAYRIYSLLKNGSFDLVHTHGYFADICGQPAASVLGINSISTCHGFIATDSKLKAYIRLEKFVLRLSRQIIAVSETIKNELIQSGINPERITVIPNAVTIADTDVHYHSRRLEKRRALNIAPNELVVGYLGRISGEKGLAFLMDAAAKMRNAGMRVKLVLVGDGPERAALEKQVKSNGLENTVVFAGFQTEIENWFPAFDVFALPSLTEGTPLALLEAMASGVPVIASAVGGVPQVVKDGVNGLLVPPGDPGAIVEKIQLLDGDSDLAGRLVRAGMVAIKENYGIENWCRKIESCYAGASSSVPKGNSLEKQTFRG